MIQAETEGGRPVDRPREYQEKERKKVKADKRERYYISERRGTRVREGLFIVPPTPNSCLVKELKRVCQEELRGCNIDMSVQERGGRTLGRAA